MDEAAELFLLINQQQTAAIERALSRLDDTPDDPVLIEVAVSQLRKAFQTVGAFLLSDPQDFLREQSRAQRPYADG